VRRGDSVVRCVRAFDVLSWESSHVFSRVNGLSGETKKNCGDSVDHAITRVLAGLGPGRSPTGACPAMAICASKNLLVYDGGGGGEGAGRRSRM